MHTNAKDEALGLPTEDAARLALRTQQIIAHETGVTNTADPVGGSVVIEQRTDEIERGAREYIQRIDAMGGTLAAIETGFIQNEIQNAAYAYQQKVERGCRLSWTAPKPTPRWEKFQTGSAPSSANTRNAETVKLINRVP